MIVLDRDGFLVWFLYNIDLNEVNFEISLHCTTLVTVSNGFVCSHDVGTLVMLHLIRISDKVIKTHAKC